MLDLKLLRKDPEGIEAKLKTKDPSISLALILELDEAIRKLKTASEELKNQRNSLSKEIGLLKQKKQDATPFMQEVVGLGEKIASLDEDLKAKEEALHHLVSVLPNVPQDHVKVSQDPKENVCIDTFGEKPTFHFPIKNHVELGEELQLFDFKRAAKCAGSHWPAYRGLGARLEWALINYMIDIHLENGYEMWMPPLLARPEIMYGSAHLPKFEAQLFKLHDEDYKLYLIPTAEAVLMGLHNDEIFKAEELPRKYVAYTPCFRREAGALGSQERGLIRMHQFNKVEMFVFCTPSQGEECFDQMMRAAETILKGLNLHYRSMLLVTGDMSFAAAKTVDIEVWLPGQNRYYEVSSISHCTDFQARRSLTRYKHREDKPEYVHTLNGSGLATSRLMVALLENNQQPDGSIAIPLVLHQYLNGLKEIKPLKK